METCKVCKQPIENLSFAVYNDTCKGYVHQGHCSDYVDNQSISETEGDQLHETELLL